MHSDIELEYFSSQLKKPQYVLYEELARDYLIYFWNKRPSKNQLIVFKKLIIDVISSCFLTFSDKLTLQEMKCLCLAFKGKTISYTAEIKKLNLSFEIMNHIDQQNLIFEHLKKAIAQAQLTLSDDFLDYSLETIHYYLSALCDNLEFIKNIVEKLIGSFLQIKEKI